MLASFTLILQIQIYIYLLKYKFINNSHVVFRIFFKSLINKKARNKIKENNNNKTKNKIKIFKVKKFLKN